MVPCRQAFTFSVPIKKIAKVLNLRLLLMTEGWNKTHHRKCRLFLESIGLQAASSAGMIL
jgi:hypothetical protein